MASKFTDFLIKLSTDPQLLADYKADAEKTMSNEGLTPAERALLLSGNAKIIREAFVNDPDHKAALGIPSNQQVQGIPIVMVTMVQP